MAIKSSIAQCTCISDTSTKLLTLPKAKVGVRHQKLGRDKDEDEIEWIRRFLRQAMKMVKSRKGKGLGR